MNDKTFHRFTGFLTLGIATYLSITVKQYIDQIFLGLLIANFYFIEADAISKVITKITHLFRGK
ncbi:MAG: hypothetical protein ACRC0A_07765 [Chitinophagaceae bacterium]